MLRVVLLYEYRDTALEDSLTFCPLSGKVVVGSLLDPRTFISIVVQIVKQPKGLFCSTVQGGCSIMM